MSKSHPVDLHVGRRIRSRRKELGLAQKDVVEGLPITFQQLQKYEVGRNRISASMLWEIARKLRKPVAYFYEGISD